MNFGALVCGGPMILEPPNLVKVMFFHIYLVTLKISCLQLKRFKSLNFGGPRLGETPILEPQILLGLVYFSYLPIPKI